MGPSSEHRKKNRGEKREGVPVSKKARGKEAGPHGRKDQLGKSFLGKHKSGAKLMGSQESVSG